MGPIRIEHRPLIRVTPPGPRSRALMQRLNAVECPGVTYSDDDFPIFWERAEGAWVEDVDGNRFLDLTGAFAVAAAGHGSAAVVEAIRAQAGRLIHGMGDVHPAEVKVRLLERLAEVTPPGLTHTLLGSSGSDAVECARKIAALHTGKPGLIAFRGAYHGLSYGALEATARRDFRSPFLSQLSGVIQHVPFPDPYRPPYGLGAEDCLRVCLAQIRALLEDPASGAQAIGGILLEPIQGRGGTIIPPDGFLRGLREICDAHGILLILDEIYTGFGRTGRAFACDHEGVVPDLLCLGKAMGGGMPISACIGTEAVMASMGPSSGEALHTQTFLGHPLSAAAALASIDAVLEGGLPERSARVGAHLLKGLMDLKARHPIVGDARGRGLMCALELVEDRDTKAPAVGLGAEVMKRALRAGLILLPSGPHGHILGFSPPLVIEPEEIDVALDILDGILAEL